ncbi:unnamed protein product, partial [Mesorhabditis belari]|uniref:THAP-type domain-containing protein n=1 Tax=Mesorhabditis belari TaxID=2138241 RepID=A0AAF3F4N3_9BILA
MSSFNEEELAAGEVNPLDTSVDAHQLALIRPRNEFFCEICRARRPGRKFYTPLDRQEQENWLIRLNLPIDRAAVLRNRMDLRQVVMCALHFPPETAEHETANLIPPMDLSIEENRNLFAQMERGLLAVTFEKGQRTKLGDKRTPSSENLITIRTNMRGRPKRQPDMPKAKYRPNIERMHDVLKFTRPRKAPSFLYEKDLLESQYVLSLLHLAEANSLSLDATLLNYVHRLAPIRIRTEAIRSNTMYEHFVCSACSVVRRGPCFPLPPPGKRRNEWVNRLALSRKEWIEPLVVKAGQLCGLHFDPLVTIGSSFDPDPDPLDMQNAENRRLFRDLYEGELKAINHIGQVGKANQFFLDGPHSMQDYADIVEMESREMNELTNSHSRNLQERRFRQENNIEYVAINDDHDQYREHVIEEEILLAPNDGTTLVVDEHGNVIETTTDSRYVYIDEGGDAPMQYVVESDGEPMLAPSKAIDKMEKRADYHQTNQMHDKPPTDFTERTLISTQKLAAKAHGRQISEHEGGHLKVDDEHLPTKRSKLGIHDVPYNDVDERFMKEYVEEEVVIAEDVVGNGENEGEQGELNVEDYDDDLDKEALWDINDAEPGTSQYVQHGLDMIQPRRYAIRQVKRVNVDMQSISARSEKRQRLWKNLQYEVNPETLRDLENKALMGQSIPICQTHFPLEMRVERMRHIEDALFPNGRRNLNCMICGRMGEAGNFCQMTKDGQSMYRLFSKTNLSHQQQEQLRTLVMNNELTLVCTDHYDAAIRPNAFFDVELEQELVDVRRKPHAKRLEYYRQTVHCVLCGKAAARPSTRKMPSHARAMQIVFDYARVSLNIQQRILDEVRRRAAHMPVCRQHFPPAMRQLRGRYWHRELEKLIQEGSFDEPVSGSTLFAGLKEEPQASNGSDISDEEELDDEEEKLIMDSPERLVLSTDAHQNDSRKD